MLEPSNTEPPPAESTGVHACLVDGTVVHPAELSELVGIFRAVLPDSTDDEALRGLDSEVVRGTGCRNGACSICCAAGFCFALRAPTANVMSASCNSAWWWLRSIKCYSADFLAFTLADPRCAAPGIRDLRAARAGGWLTQNEFEEEVLRLIVKRNLMLASCSMTAVGDDNLTSVASADESTHAAEAVSPAEEQMREVERAQRASGQTSAGVREVEWGAEQHKEIDTDVAQGGETEDIELRLRMEYGSDKVVRVRPEVVDLSAYAYLKELQAIFRKHQKEQTAVQAGANPDYKTLEVENLLNIEDL